MIMIHFIRPIWLFAFVPVIVYLLWIIYFSRQNNPWQDIVDPHLLPILVQENKKHSQYFFYSALFLLFIIGIFALAGPTWKKTQLPMYQELNSTMLVLDLSPNMEVNDLKPNRLTRAKFKIRDFINVNQNMQMGLVVFSREAFTVAPLSQDANTLNALLDELNPQMMPISGADMAQGINEGITLLKQAGISHSNLLLITASAPTAESWNAAKLARDAGYSINILAMFEENLSTQQTISALQNLANLSGGNVYLFTNDNRDIQNILAYKNASSPNIKERMIETSQLWQDAGPWFCLFLIPLLLFVLREKLP